MMKKSIILFVLALGGCMNLGYQNMTAEQIKATAGTTTCTQFTGMYGKGAAIALNADDTKKGVSSTNDISISCGDASLTIKATNTAPVPAGASTVTTTTVTPAKLTP